MRNISLGLLLLALPEPAYAIVGGAAASEEGIARSVVTIVGSRGSFCSGALIAPDIVLSAAHCITSGTVYKIIIPGETPPRLRDVRGVATHSQFNVQGMIAHRASADIALLQLAAPLPNPKVPSPFSAPAQPITVGAIFTVAGIGVTKRDDGKSGGTIRSVRLTATGKPGNLQIRLVDPTTNNLRDGFGACTGDSGAPVFEDQNGRAVIVGVVSWSTGANSSAGCGGFTGVTPLTLYRTWIVETASKMESAIR